MNRTLAIRVAAVVGVAAAIFIATPAEARFGKRSSGNAEKSEEKKGDSRKDDREDSGRRSHGSRTHAATAVGDDDGGYSGGGHHSGHVHTHGRVVVRPSVRYYGHYHSHGPVYVAPPTVYAPPPPERRADPFELRRFELEGSAQPMLNGGMLGAHLKVDWRSFGMDVRYDYLALLAEDGSLTFDTIQLADVAATFALIDGEHGRLRGHLGVYTALAPDMIFVGPGGGFSASVKVVGPLTADAGAQLVLIPFTKVDTWAGAGLRFGAVEGRAGMRFTVLDDQGRVDGVRHTDVMAGPFVSLSLVL